MTTKALQQKLIHSRTSLPPRISSGPIAGGNNCSNNNKWNKYICKFIHDLSTIIQFCSPLLIMMAILYDSIIVPAVAFGLFLLKILVLDIFLFKMGKIRNWPNKVSQKINVVSIQIILQYYSIQWVVLIDIKKDTNLIAHLNNIFPHDNSSIWLLQQYLRYLRYFLCFQKQIMVCIFGSGSLTVFIVIAWLFGYPIGQIFVSDITIIAATVFGLP